MNSQPETTIVKPPWYKKLTSLQIGLIIAGLLLLLLLGVLLTKLPLNQLLGFKINNSKFTPTLTPEVKQIGFVSKQTTIKQIIKPQEIYLLTQSTGEDMTVLIDDKTIVAVGVPQYDKDNHLKSFKYENVTRQNLEKIKVGSKVAVTYPTDKTDKETIAVSEFIIQN